jgi:hypothetical protein
MAGLDQESLNAAHRLPGRPFEDAMYMSRNPGELSLYPSEARHGGRCHVFGEVPPFYLATGERAALLLAVGEIEPDPGETVVVRRGLTEIAVDLVVLDLLNPLAQQECSIEPGALGGLDRTATRQLMDVVRGRADVEGLLLECPARLREAEPDGVMLAVLPEAAQRLRRTVLRTRIVEVQFAPSSAPTLPS